MNCPFCNSSDTHVKDSRPCEDGNAIRRRRYCENCDARFTTFERVHIRDLNVIKNNGEVVLFERDKIRKSFLIATRKRNISDEIIEKAISDIISDLEKSGENTIKSSSIGKKVLTKLKHIDKVAYVRYASVYMDFSNLSDFESILEDV